MDFMEWWFDCHYILSTLLSPGVTILWLVYTSSLSIRWFFAILWLLVRGIINVRKDRERRTNEF